LTDMKRRCDDVMTLLQECLDQPAPIPRDAPVTIAVFFPDIHNPWLAYDLRKRPVFSILVLEYASRDGVLFPYHESVMDTYHIIRSGA